MPIGHCVTKTYKSLPLGQKFDKYSAACGQLVHAARVLQPQPDHFGQLTYNALEVWALLRLFLC